MRWLTMIKTMVVSIAQLMLLWWYITIVSVCITTTSTTTTTTNRNEIEIMQCVCYMKWKTLPSLTRSKAASTSWPGEPTIDWPLGGDNKQIQIFSFFPSLLPFLTSLLLVVARIAAWISHLWAIIWVSWPIGGHIAHVVRIWARLRALCVVVGLVLVVANIVMRRQIASLLSIAVITWAQ